MEKIIFNKKIAENIWNDRALRDELADVLNLLMDAELEKDDCEMDFDLLDAYAEALNELYDEEDLVKVVWKLQTVEEFMDTVRNDRKYKIISRSLKAVLAACAALMLLFAANTVTEKTTGVDVIGEVANAMKNILTGESQVNDASEAYEDGLLTMYEIPTQDGTTASAETETSDVSENPTPAKAHANSGEQDVQPGISPQNPDLALVLSPEEMPTDAQGTTTTRPPFTRVNEDETAAPVVIKLTGAYGSDFKRDYLVGESADFSGLTVTAQYDNGTEKEIPIGACGVHGFSTDSAAIRIVTVEYEGCSFSFLIKVREAS